MAILQFWFVFQQLENEVSAIRRNQFEFQPVFIEVIWMRREKLAIETTLWECVCAMCIIDFVDGCMQNHIAHCKKEL